jgi:hypothetical protein
VTRLEDLRKVFGGRIREFSERRWLDTRVGGLRAFIVSRATDRGTTFDLAVFTPSTRELDPFFAREDGLEWQLEGDLVLPCLRAGFSFTGCRRGILFARNHDEPSLDSMVSTLWDLAEWARKPWLPPHGSVGWQEQVHDRVRVRREHWIRIGLVVLVAALVLWLRAPSLSTLLALLIARPLAMSDATPLS